MSKTITKADITEHLHNELGLNKSECKTIVEDFFDEIKQSLINNEDVTISARRVVTFRAGNKLRQKIASFHD
jgi:integration host factor subunit alpha